MTLLGWQTGKLAVESLPLNEQSGKNQRIFKKHENVECLIYKKSFYNIH